jgi:hypothetical protein
MIGRDDDDEITEAGAANTSDLASAALPAEPGGTHHSEGHIIWKAYRHSIWLTFTSFVIFVIFGDFSFSYNLYS